MATGAIGLARERMSYASADVVRGGGARGGGVGFGGGGARGAEVRRASEDVRTVQAVAQGRPGRKEPARDEKRGADQAGDRAAEAARDRVEGAGRIDAP